MADLAPSVLRIRHLIPDLKKEYIQDDSIETIIAMTDNIWEAAAMACETVGSQFKLKHEGAKTYEGSLEVASQVRTSDFFLRRARTLREEGRRKTQEYGYFEFTEFDVRDADRQLFHPFGNYRIY